jgi:imidazolonepropionase
MKLLVKNASSVITCSSRGKPFKRGREMNDVGELHGVDIFIEDGTIRDIGRLEPNPDCEIIDASGKILLPGFIDSSTSPWTASQQNANDVDDNRTTNYSWIDEPKQNQETSRKSKSNFHMIQKWIDKMMKWGTTAFEMHDTVGLDFKNEIRTFEMIGKLKEDSIADIVVTISSDISAGGNLNQGIFDKRSKETETLTNEIIPYFARRGLAQFFELSSETPALANEEMKKILDSASRNGFKLRARSTGNSHITKIGTEFCATSIEYVEGITNDEIDLLERNDTIAVILPAISAYRREKFIPARTMIDKNCAIALASGFDPKTSMIDNMQTVMWLGMCFNKMTVEETLNAVTINAAAALGLSDKLGSIEVGKQADILVANADNYALIPYHFTDNKIEKLIKRGVVLEFH